MKTPVSALCVLRPLVAVACLSAAGTSLAQSGPYGPYGTVAPTPMPVAPYGAPYPAAPRAAYGPVDEYRASVDLYGSTQRFHNSNGSQSDDGGFGIRARLGITPHLFVDGEVQGNRYDNGNDDYGYGYNGYRDDNYSDLYQYRIGGGVVTRLAPIGLAAAPPQIWAKAQYTEFETYTRNNNYGYANQQNGNGYYYDYDSTTHSRGPGVHVGARIPVSPFFGVYGQAGYLWLSGDGARLDGPEFTGGFDITPLPFRFDRLKIFAEYRYTDLQGRNDQSGDARLGDFRAGVRFGFGR